jgi:hypothetical protein
LTVAGAAAVTESVELGAAVEFAKLGAGVTGSDINNIYLTANGLSPRGSGYNACI